MRILVTAASVHRGRATESDLREHGYEVVFGVYDLESRHVGWPGYDRTDRRGHVLLDPPDDASAFSAQAALLASGPQITKLLYS